ncbi:MAG: YggT family protein [Polyangiaceae bacterium]
MFLVALALDAYSLVVLLAVICSWVNLAPDHPVVRFTSRLTEPALEPIRRVLPNIGGMDFSPMLLLFLLRLVKRVVLR